MHNARLPQLDQYQIIFSVVLETIINMEISSAISNGFIFLSKNKTQIDSVNKPGILLEVVQILTDLDFIITKAYISSDGGWFMDGTFPNELKHELVMH